MNVIVTLSTTDSATLQMETSHTEELKRPDTPSAPIEEYDRCSLPLPDLK